MSEKLKSLFLGQDQSVKGLGLGHDSLGGILNSLVVGLFEKILTSVRVVEETCVGGRTVTQLHAKFLLEGFAEHVSA